MRRPKKLSRRKNGSSNNGAQNSSNASIAANRLGPGMETLDLSLTLGDCYALSGGANGALKMGKQSVEPWIITWQVGVGASVDKGMVLAKVVRSGGAGENGSKGQVAARREHVVTGMCSERMLHSTVQ